MKHILGAKMYATLKKTINLDTCKQTDYHMVKKFSRWAKGYAFYKI